MLHRTMTDVPSYKAARPRAEGRLHMTLFKNLSRQRRSNLAALVAILIVSALASAPTVVTSLHGGVAPTYATLAALHADAGFLVASNETSRP
jgi:hypothetical protein